MSKMELVYKLRADASALARGLRDGQSKFDGFAKSAAGSLAKVATAAAAVGGVLGGLSVKAAGDFEQSIANAGAKAGATAEQIKQLSAAAKQAGIESAFSAKQAADALGLLAQSGLTVEEQTEALPGLLALASAGALDLALATDIAIGSLKGFGLGVEEMGRVNDVLAKAANSANTNIEDLGLAMSYAAPTAAALGVSIEESAAVIGILANAGIKGSRAGTSLNGMLALMVDVSDKLGAGLSSADIETKGLIGSLETLAANGLTGANAMDLFGQRAGPAVAALLGQGIDSIKTLKTSLENAGGAAAEAAARQLDTMNGQIQLLQGSAETLAITLGETLTPVIKEMAAASIEQINALLENKGAMADFADEVADGVDYVADAIKALSPIITVVTTAAGALVDTLKAIQVIGNGLALAVGMIHRIGLAADAVATGSTAKLDAFDQRMQALADETEALTSELGDATKAGVEAGNKLSEAGDKIADSMRKGAENVRKMADEQRKLNAAAAEFTPPIDEDKFAAAFDQGIGYLNQFSYELDESEEAVHRLARALAGASDGVLSIADAAALLGKKTDKAKDDLKKPPKAAAPEWRALNFELEKFLDHWSEVVDAGSNFDTEFDGAWSFGGGEVSNEFAKQLEQDARDAERELERIAEAGRRVFEDTRTPLERFNAAIADLARLLNSGAISAETYLRAVDKLAVDFKKAEKSADEMKDELETVNDKLLEMGRGAAGLLFEEFERALFDPFSRSTEEMVRDFAIALGKMAARAAASQILSAMGGNAAGAAGPGFAGGGLVRGPGTATSDSIPARLSDGEFVMRAAAVRHYGAAFLAKMNAIRLPRGYAAGGAVERPSGDQAITIANLFSEEELERFLSSRSGERVIMNVLRRTGALQR